MLKKMLAGLFCISLLTGCAGIAESSTAALEVSGETAASEIIYVNDDATGNDSGRSWSNAFNSLQDALEAAEDGDEIWVAEGTYYPSETSREESFTMLDGVDVYGGFTGNETERSQRAWENNETILSGEIGDPNSIEDNVKNIVIAADAIIDGFTMKHGYSKRTGNPGEATSDSQGQTMQGQSSQGQPHQGQQSQGQQSQGQPPQNMSNQSGGNDVGHMTPEQILSGDATTCDHGSAIIVWEKAPTVQNCKFVENTSSKGGAVYIINTLDLDEQPKFVNCYFGDNYAEERGGAVSIDLQASAVFIDSVFEDNACNGKGGAIYNDMGCSPLFENCLFIGNEAQSGGALGNDGSSTPVISNSTFYGNVANEVGAALYQGSGPYNDPTVINSIIWNNICEEDVASVYDWNECNTKIEYSIVEGGFVGTGILDTDPMFVDPENNNFNLSISSAGLGASDTNGKIGFNKDLTGNRTENDLDEIITMLYSVEKNEEPVAMNITNTKTKSDAQNIGDVIYVKKGGNGDGSTWSQAIGSLQEAIDLGNAAYDSDGKSVDIYVAEGTYYTGDERSDSIILRSGLNIYGGFDGSETALNQRDIENNKTVLSGDIGIKDDISDNSYHVLIGSDDVVIDGFTITGGNANKVDGEVYDNKGGGLLNYSAGNRIVPDYTPVLGFDTVVKNCEFEGNHAAEGAASYTYHGGNPVFENCSFTDNTSDYGGAVLDRAGTNRTYTDCVFKENTANYKGGAAFVDYGSMATFESCEFNDNKSGSAGGAIYIIDRASQAITNETDINEIDESWSLPMDIYSSVLVKDNVFSGNKAGSNGGAVYVYESSNLKVDNTDFMNNTAGNNGNDIGVFYKSTLYLDKASSFKGEADKSIYVEEDSQVISQ